MRSTFQICRLLSSYLLSRITRGPRVLVHGRFEGLRRLLPRGEYLGNVGNGDVKACYISMKEAVNVGVWIGSSAI